MCCGPMAGDDPLLEELRVTLRALAGDEGDLIAALRAWWRRVLDEG